jgi:hypothetical protein
MANAPFILYLLAFICFCLGAAGVPSRVGWEPLGLAFWVLVYLLGVSPGLK